MNILKHSQVFMGCFGIVSIPKQSLPSFLRNYQTAIRFLLLAFTIINSIVYGFALVHFIIFKARSLPIFFVSALFASTSIMRATLFILMLWHRPKLTIIIKDLEQVIQERSVKPAIRSTYLNEIETSEMYVAKASKYVLSTFIVSSSIKLFQSYYGYYMLDTGAASFKPILPVSWPFDWQTPCGYVVLTIVHCSWMIGNFCIISSVIMMFSGICGIFKAFSIDIQEKLSDLNGIIDKYLEHINIDERKAITKHLYAVIDFQVKANELKVRFLEMYSYILTACFALSMPAICISLLILNLAVDSGRMIEVIRLIAIFGATLFYSSVFCLVGDTVTSRYQEINDAFWQISWIELPSKERRMFPVILSYSQKPICMEGFMNVKCTKEMLKIIIKGSFSYFSVLRGFSH